MTADAWRKRIIEATNVEIQRYQSVIDTLSDILEQRDSIYEQYKANPMPVVEHTNKAGATNTEKNPLLRAWVELNSLALSYFKELGMTPAAYKKMAGEAPVEKKESALITALKAM